MFKKGHPKYPNSLDVHISKKVLLDLYSTKGKYSVKTIAEHYRCSDVCIYGKLKKYGIKLRGSKVDDTKLYDLYIERKKSLRKIADYFNCGKSTILRHLRKAKIKMREPGTVKHSELAKQKNRLSHLGKRHSIESRLKMGLKGEKNPSWKGGVTPKLHKIRTSAEYELWRIAVFSRDNWTCQKCNKRGGNLEAHHIKGFRKYPELRFAIDNGITYCSICHCKMDKQRRIK